MTKSPTSPPDQGFRFSGFIFPNYTQIPDQLFDELLPLLSGAELKVLLYICRRTFGFKKPSDDISFNQLITGIATKGGKVLDRGTGLSKSSVARALNDLEAKNIILRNRNESNERGHEATTYSLNLGAPPLSQNETRGLSQNRTSPCPKIEQALVPKSNIQEIEQQQTDLQETATTGAVESDNTDKDSASKHDVVVALVRHGISEKTARRLAGRHTAARVLEKIDFLNYLKEHDPERVKNPQGWLRKAIEDDYAAPDGYQSPAERAAAEAAQRRHDEVITRAAEEAERRLEAQAARQREELAQKQQAEAARLAELRSRYGTTAREGEIWQQVLDELKFQLPDAVFQSHLATSELLTVRNERDGAAVVMLRDGWTRDWVANRLSVKIQRLLAQHVEGGEVTLQFVAFEPPPNGAGG
jgi:DNA-binding MarR family transcriptional regulator